jgi:hypothetical protein
MDPGFRPETLVAVDAVARALEVARRRVGAADIIAKGGRDLVTAADGAVEDAVRAIVSQAVGAPVVGEERGGEAPADGSPYWITHDREGDLAAFHEGEVHAVERHAGRKVAGPTDGIDEPVPTSPRAATSRW